MPESLYFIFQLARDYSPSGSDGEQKDGERDRGGQGQFLSRVIKPLYDVVFDEGFASVSLGRRPEPLQPAPLHPKIYDDFNERFWTLRSLLKLRTKRGDTVMAAHPAARWALLLEADWASFFNTEGKTFHEIRWWHSLTAANRRVFLFHLLTFAISYELARPRVPYWSFGGWGVARIVPFVVLLITLCRAFGCTFERLAIGTIAEQHAAQLSYLLLLTVGVAAAVNLHSQRLAFADVMTQGATGKWAFGLSGLVLVLIGTPLAILELLPMRAAPGTSLDDSLRFERRTSELHRQRWVDEGGRLQPAVRAVARLYGFWSTVWALKLFFAGSCSLPVFFDITERIDRAFDDRAFAAAGLRLLPPFDPADVLTSGLIGGFASRCAGFGLTSCCSQAAAPPHSRRRSLALGVPPLYRRHPALLQPSPLHLWWGARSARTRHRRRTRAKGPPASDSEQRD